MSNDSNNSTNPLLQVWYDLIGVAARLRTTLGEIPEEALTSGEAGAIQDALAHLGDAQQALSDRLELAPWRHFLVLTPGEFATLLWMGVRGYEAGLVERADVVHGALPDEEPNPMHPGLVTLCYYEHNLTGMSEQIAKDPDAWCACAPRALASKLRAFYDDVSREED